MDAQQVEDILPALATLTGLGILRWKMTQEGLKADLLLVPYTTNDQRTNLRIWNQSGDSMAVDFELSDGEKEIVHKITTLAAAETIVEDEENERGAAN